MMKKVITLALCVGVLPFLLNARACAQETKTDSEQQPKENRWFDDYSKPVGFTYDGKAHKPDIKSLSLYGKNVPKGYWSLI